MNNLDNIIKIKAADAAPRTSTIVHVHWFSGFI